MKWLYNSPILQTVVSTLLRGLILSDFWEYIGCFLLASSILWLSTDDSFAEHHKYLDHSINFISLRCHFLISTDSFSLHPLQIVDSLAESYWINRHMPKDRPDFVDKMVMSDPSVLLSRAKIWTCSLGWKDINGTGHLPYCLRPEGRETITESTLPVTYSPSKKSTESDISLLRLQMNSRKFSPSPSRVSQEKDTSLLTAFRKKEWTLYCIHNEK